MQSIARQNSMHKFKIAECFHDSAADSVSDEKCDHQTFEKRKWNSCGWIRVYCGPYRDVIDFEEPSRMVNVLSIATTADVIREMDISLDYTLWVSSRKIGYFESYTNLRVITN